MSEWGIMGFEFSTLGSQPSVPWVLNVKETSESGVSPLVSGSHRFKCCTALPVHIHSPT